MKNRTRAVLAAAAFGLATLAAPFGSPAGATHLCNSEVIPIATPAATFYFQDRPAPGQPNGLLFAGGEGTWIFMESNGKPGLQVGGKHPVDPLNGLGFKDPCPSSGTPDTVIF